MYVLYFHISSVQFSRLVVSDSLRPRESQHARPPCPSPTPGVHPNPCPSRQWCHETISSSVVPFSSCPQSFPALGSFPMGQLFAWGGQSVGVSASVSVHLMNTQDWSPLRCTGWISLQFKGLSTESSPIPQFKSINSSALSFLQSPTLTSTHDYWKNHSLDRWTFVDKAVSLLFNMLTRLVITFLPRSKHLLTSWLPSPFAVILEPPKIKFDTLSTVSPSIFPWTDGTRCHDFSFLNAELYANFFTLLFHFHQEAFSSSSLSAIRVVIVCISEVIDISPGKKETIIKT